MNKFIESLKKDEPTYGEREWTDFDCGQCSGYNQAIDDLAERIMYWRPIKELPDEFKDGTSVLLCSNEGAGWIHRCFWSTHTDEGWILCDTMQPLNGTPTHHMLTQPLPPTSDEVG